MLRCCDLQHLQWIKARPVHQDAWSSMKIMFTCGQAYVAISRARRWQDISIISFPADAFRTNTDVVREYERLQHIANKHNIYDWQSGT